MAHTPGPWQFETDEPSDDEDWRIYSPQTDNGDDVAVIHKTGDPEYDIDVVYANARLILAAPDLLEQLKHVVRWWDQITHKDVERYKAAIAKATE